MNLKKLTYLDFFQKILTIRTIRIFDAQYLTVWHDGQIITTLTFKSSSSSSFRVFHTMTSYSTISFHSTFRTRTGIQKLKFCYLEIIVFYLTILRLMCGDKEIVLIKWSTKKKVIRKQGNLRNRNWNPKKFRFIFCF